MRTPDGRDFRPRPGAGLPARAGRAGLAVLRALGKGVATVWRVAGALDSALWSGCRLIAGSVWRGAVAAFRIARAAALDLVAWLPTRTGRAYSAFSGLVVIIAGLYIADELRVAPQATEATADGLRAPVDLEDPILARISGRYVHLSDVASAALASGALREGETLTPQMAFDRELVAAYVEQRLLARAALDEGVQRNPQVARQLNAARDRILASAYLQSRISLTVTDEAVQRLYARQSDVTRLGDEVRARHILVATGEEASEILAALQQGEAFEDLARRRSIDRATAPLGGEIGYFTRDMMTPTLSAAAFSTPVGSVASPFQSEFGWHVLEVLDRRRSRGVAFDAVKDNIRRFLTLRTIDATLARLKQESEVVFYPARLPPGSSTAGGAESPGGNP